MHELADAAPREARRAARAEVKTELRKFWPRIIVAVSVIVVLIVLLGGWSVANLYVRQAVSESAITSLRQQADTAKAAGEKANTELQARGQPTVPIPNPGSAPDSDVIVQSAAARVLASLSGRYVTFSDLGGGIAQYFAANPITPAGPTPMQIFGSLAAYFATNPPPAGPQGLQGEAGQPGAQGEKGDKGDKGDPPTVEEIQAAFVAYLHDHPDALCPNGGSFAQIRVQLADGGAADTWQCVVATYPATNSPPPDTPTPTPTGG
ncbi:hypothetical protein [Amycolatopsis sp. NPDC051372]|uniref:collagen-like triple helix repeat-containing protein n=1 Tax=Amycolatopsis sp. NPDC051372 TaxID=3155669 RepID=UPI003417210B